MPLKLNVGVSKKLGLPEYSSVGASCNVEIELDPGLLEHDLDAFHDRARAAYMACHLAVEDDLARSQATARSAVHGRNGTASTNGTHASRGGSANGRPRLPATASQVRAIIAIARKQDADLEGLLRDEYGVDRPEDLSLRGEQADRPTQSRREPRRRQLRPSAPSHDPRRTIMAGLTVTEKEFWKDRIAARIERSVEAIKAQHPALFGAA